MTTAPDSYSMMIEAIRLMGQRAEARHVATARAIVEIASDRWIRHRDHDGALHAAHCAIMSADHVVRATVASVGRYGAAWPSTGVQTIARDATGYHRLRMFDRAMEAHGPDTTVAEAAWDLAGAIGEARGAYRPDLRPHGRAIRAIDAEISV